MEKEIHEQPDAISHTISAMTDSNGRLTAGLDVITYLRSRVLCYWQQEQVSMQPNWSILD
ncbi:MAG: hypothetical protein CM15mP117_02510 [Alphaproteobacteria bacterium]|nr:MAG: hypothetical protein CM15mP117_02510 [Alphaproteobacteria bacterium]